MGGDGNGAAPRDREVACPRRACEPGRHWIAPARRARSIPARVAYGDARVGAAAHERAKDSRAAGGPRSRRAPGPHGEPRGVGLRADHLHRPALQPPPRASGCGPVAGTAAPLDGSAAANVLLASRTSAEIKTLWCDGLSAPSTRRSTSSSSISRWSGAMAGRTTRRTIHGGGRSNPSATRMAALPGRSSSTCSTGSRPRTVDLHARAVVAAASRSQPRSATTRWRPEAAATRSMPWPQNGSGELFERARSSGGVITVTGSPSASTRRRSFWSHSERRLGSVEMMTSS